MNCDIDEVVRALKSSLVVVLIDVFCFDSRKTQAKRGLLLEPLE